ncbi:site-specific recombinase [Comamonas sp. Y6]|uniref:Site-specific recombinase n=1 Tax=Comamonas resistens TaxID=3046670 RepID=A0ABY8SVG2_9BURK|nr:site-specific recombinase [Comamonas resistens]MDL5035882.1 site-specific recombinase [Comamonas resistens]WHS65286.1 site-specific recombinase [Comamonas resistens]
MKKLPPDLPRLIQALDPHADLAQRHLWLIHLVEWIRAPKPSLELAVDRMEQVVAAFEADADARQRLGLWWQKLLETVDITALLADFGFAPRTAMASEVAERLRYKLLPSTPETVDASELFMLVFPDRFDARWLHALDSTLMARISALVAPPSDEGASFWERNLLDAITYCAGQILSTGFAPELRLRMSEQAREEKPFHALIHDVENLRVEVMLPLRTTDRRDAAAAQLRERLEACRSAVSSVYSYVEAEGISVGLIFRLRQVRARILRIRRLLDCLLSTDRAYETSELLSNLVAVGLERRSVRALLSTNTSLLAAKVAERSAETGEHYITRDKGEYRNMMAKAAGGGFVMAFTTLAKFALYALGLSVFWSGLAAGMNYALSFVLIQMLHFTVATKQPAMTAPAMAAKLKDIQSDDSIQEFVDEVAHLVRSQVAAILGNVLIVFPAAMALTMGYAELVKHPALSPSHATQVLESLSLLGPSVLFAAFTGVLLFASSLIAGGAENWFVLRNIDSVIRYNPRITRVLGTTRADRWARFLRKNISGLASNISLGFMLGLVPAFAAFFGLGLEVRHVTLSTGQIGVAIPSLGWEVLHSNLLWWAVAMLPFNAALNVGVSFYLAFRLALRAHNVSGVDRSRIYKAIRQRFWRRPLSFFWP